MIWVFLAGLAVGTLLGVGIICILQVAGRADDALERQEITSSDGAGLVSVAPGPDTRMPMSIRNGPIGYNAPIPGASAPEGPLSAFTGARECRHCGTVHPATRFQVEVCPGYEPVR